MHIYKDGETHNDTNGGTDLCVEYPDKSSSATVSLATEKYCPNNGSKSRGIIAAAEELITSENTHQQTFLLMNCLYSNEQIQQAPRT